MRSSHRSLTARDEFDPGAAEMKRSRLAAAASVALRCKLPLVGGALVGVTVLAFGGTALAVPTPVGLGTATNDAVVASAAPTNTGVSTINGDVASSPIATQPGFAPCPGANCVVYTPPSTQHINDGPAAGAVAAAHAALITTQGATPSLAILPQLGGTTLPAGVYNTGAANITGTFTLDAANDPSSTWIFQAASSITTATNSNVVFVNVPGSTTAAALACNVFWTAGSDVTLNGTTFVGTVMATAGIHVGDGVTIQGRLLAGTDVTLIHDTIDKGNCTVLAAGSGGSPASTGGGTGGGTAGTGGGTTGTVGGFGTGHGFGTAVSVPLAPATPVVATPQTAG